MRDAKGEFRSKVYTDRPAYADYDAPEKSLQNMDEKIAYEFDSYHGGACTGLSFEFSHGRAMFSREIFSGCAAIRLGGEYAKGVYILTPNEYKERLRRILEK